MMKLVNKYCKEFNPHHAVEKRICNVYISVIPVVEFSVSICSTSITNQNLSATSKIINETFFFLMENDSNPQTLICIYEEKKIICRYKSDVTFCFFKMLD